MLSATAAAQSLQLCRLFVTLWTIACQAPLSMGFSRQEYWSGLPCPPPGDLSNPGIEPASLTSPVLAGGFFNTKPPRKPSMGITSIQIHPSEEQNSLIFVTPKSLAANLVCVCVCVCVPAHMYTRYAKNNTSSS